MRLLFIKYYFEIKLFLKKHFEIPENVRMSLTFFGFLVSSVAENFVVPWRAFVLYAYRMKKLVKLEWSYRGLIFIQWTLMKFRNFLAKFYKSRP